MKRYQNCKNSTDVCGLVINFLFMNEKCILFTHNIQMFFDSDFS